MKKLREDDEENFQQELFRTLVGAKPYSDRIPAKLYDINKEYLTFEQVKFQSNEEISQILCSFLECNFSFKQ